MYFNYLYIKPFRSTSIMKKIERKNLLCFRVDHKTSFICLGPEDVAEQIISSLYQPVEIVQNKTGWPNRMRARLPIRRSVVRTPIMEYFYPSIKISVPKYVFRGNLLNFLEHSVRVKNSRIFQKTLEYSKRSCYQLFVIVCQYVLSF